jgi:hypothetical protein
LGYIRSIDSTGANWGPPSFPSATAMAGDDPGVP